MEHFQQSNRSLIEKLRALYNSEKFSDFQFKIDTNVVYAHRLILMLGSSVFEAQFNDKTDTSDSLVIENVKLEVFLEFLHFFYTETCKITKENMFDLLSLAHEYKNYKLEEALVSFLVNIPRSDNPQKLDLFQTCFEANHSFLMNRFKLDICEDLGKFLTYKTEFCELKRNTVAQLLQLDHIDRNANEFKIFEMLMQWIKHNNDLSSVDLLKLIRFTTMEMNEFAKCVVMQGNILSDKELGSVVKCIITPDEPCENFNKEERILLDKIEIEWAKIPSTRMHTIKFTVTAKLSIRGLWITRTSGRQRCCVTCNSQTGDKIRESIVNSCNDHDLFVPVLFREPIEAQPNLEYTINVVYDIVNQDYIAIRNNTLVTAQHGQFINISTTFDCLYYVDFNVCADVAA